MRLSLFLKLVVIFWAAGQVMTLAHATESHQQMVECIASHMRLAGTSPTHQSARALFEGVQGKKVKDIAALPFFVERDSQVYVLGDGSTVSGGLVYRVVPARGRTEVYKYCLNNRTAEEEWKQFQILYEVSQEPGYQGLKVAKPISRKGQLIILANHFGETVNNLESTGNIPEDLKREIHEKYLAKLTETFNALKKKIPSLRRSTLEDGEGLFSYESGGPFRDSFLLHDGNVLVDPKTLEMTIIDPH